MRNRMPKATVISKLVRSKSFIVVTDDESFIGLKRDDKLTLYEQRAAVQLIQDTLQNVIKEFDRVLGNKKKAASKKAAKKATK